MNKNVILLSFVTAIVGAGYTGTQLNCQPAEPLSPAPQTLSGQLSYLPNSSLFPAHVEIAEGAPEDQKALFRKAVAETNTAFGQTLFTEAEGNWDIPVYLGLEPGSLGRIEWAGMHASNGVISVVGGMRDTNVMKHELGHCLGLSHGQEDEASNSVMHDPGAGSVFEQRDIDLVNAMLAVTRRQR